MSLAKRLSALEQATPPGQLRPPGVRTVKFEPFKGRRGWPPDGFTLETLRPAKRPPGPPVFEARSAESIRRENMARDRLKGLPRDEQVKLAKRLGFRVIYVSSANEERSR